MHTFFAVLFLTIAACILAFWLGRVTRDNEVKGLKEARDFQDSRATSWRNRADELLAQKDTAIAAQCRSDLLLVETRKQLEAKTAKRVPAKTTKKR